jgi:hypothetical protein
MISIADLSTLDTFDKVDKLSLSAIADKSIFKWKIPDDTDALYNKMVELSDKPNILKLLAMAGRVEEALKKPVFKAEKLVKDIPALLNLSGIASKDDRYHAAQFVSRLAPRWLYQWALNNLWAEVSSDKSRMVFLNIILSDNASLEQILLDIGDAGNVYAKTGKLNEPQVSSRFIKVIKTLIASCNSRSLEFDLALGLAVDDLIRKPFSSLTKAQTKANSRKILIPQVASLLLVFIEHRFSIALETNLYTILGRMRTWCDDNTWRHLVLQSASLSKLSDTIGEALRVSVEQGIIDDELLNYYKNSVATRHHFRSSCQRIALLENVAKAPADWLKSEGEKKQNRKRISSDLQLKATVEANELAEMLVQVEYGLAQVKLLDTALPDLEIFDPSLIPVVKNTVSRWDMIKDIVKRLADRESLKLIGEIGGVEEVNLKVFEMTGKIVGGYRRGTIVRPAIVKLGGNKKQIIMKGIMKGLED